MSRFTGWCIGGLVGTAIGVAIEWNWTGNGWHELGAFVLMFGVALSCAYVGWDVTGWRARRHASDD